MRSLSLIFSFTLFFCRAATAQQAPLWIPAEDSDKEQVFNILETAKDLKLTAALGVLPKNLEERAKKLAAEGRLEPAMRIPGDPLLPLFYYPGEQSVMWQNKPSTPIAPNDQYFLSLRLAQAKDAYLKTFKMQPQGLVSAPGGFLADYTPLIKALGLKWTAMGPSVSTAAAVFECAGIYAVPFLGYSSQTAPGAAAAFTVFDETLPGIPQEETRQGLLSFLGTKPAGGWLTVSQALKTAVSLSVTAEELSAARPWSGDYTPWAAAPAQTGALTAFAKTRADLMLYLNEKQGDYTAARNAFDAYHAAEDGSRLARLAPAAPELSREAETEIQSSLSDTYRLMEKNPPAWLFSGFAEMLSGDLTQDKLAVSVDTTGFKAVNSSRKPALPEGAPMLSKDSDPYKVWKLSSFEMALGETETVFRFYPLQIDNSRRSPAGFSYARFDLYIDINHSPQAGSTKLLEGADGRLFPDNAWDYALKVLPGSAAFYLSTTRGPKLLGHAAALFENGAVTVRIPKLLLGGNPLSWGYAALILAPTAGEKYFITDYIASDFSNGYFYALRPR
ncbi:MAG TPA: hypothetical protein DCL44_08215 [Elusimicrobia bacterium]|nr:hypothetical protein [Elusimicrobiota bacterium]